MLVQPQIDTYSFDDDNFSLSSSENDVFFCFPLSRQYFSRVQKEWAHPLLDGSVFVLLLLQYQLNFVVVVWLHPILSYRFLSLS